jgi:hypothetical protein
VDNAGGIDVAPGLVRERFDAMESSSSEEDALRKVLFESSSRLRLEEDGWGTGDALLEAGGEGGNVAGNGLVTGPSI